jgi:fatty acid desaturase
VTYLFFPLHLRETVCLHVVSIPALTRWASRRRPADRALFTAHAASYFTAVFLVLSPVKAAVFIVVQQGLFAPYLGCSCAPNHKGMPSWTQPTRATSAPAGTHLPQRRGGRLTDVALGGLNYQIEHHLFPSTPRPSPRRSRP